MVTPWGGLQVLTIVGLAGRLLHGYGPRCSPVRVLFKRPGPTCESHRKLSLAGLVRAMQQNAYNVDRRASSDYAETCLPERAAIGGLGSGSGRVNPAWCASKPRLVSGACDPGLAFPTGRIGLRRVFVWCVLYAKRCKAKCDRKARPWQPCVAPPRHRLVVPDMPPIARRDLMGCVRRVGARRAAGCMMHGTS